MTQTTLDRIIGDTSTAGAVCGHCGGGGTARRPLVCYQWEAGKRKLVHVDCNRRANMGDAPVLLQSRHDRLARENDLLDNLLNEMMTMEFWERADDEGMTPSDTVAAAYTAIRRRFAGEGK